MPTPTKGHRLGGSPAHERLITFAKRGDLHARRHVLTVVTDKGVVHQLFTEIAPEFSERDGGYTRITKIGPRKGDNAAMAVIELVRGEAVTAKPRRRTRRAETKAAVSAGTAAEAATAAAVAEPEAAVADETAEVGESSEHAEVDESAEDEAGRGDEAKDEAGRGDEAEDEAGREDEAEIADE